MDFIKAKEEFKEYLKAYDTENSSVKLKIVHTYHVVEFSEYIAKAQGINEENVEIAKLIALLHDIGRFEQLKELNDFSDIKGIDHADLGVEILFNNGLIRKFIEEDKYDKIIKVAIANHNKYKIEDGLTELEVLHSKIIRDADKLDIFYEVIEVFYNEKEIEEINQSIIDDNIISKIYEKKTINRNELKQKSSLIKILIVLAFIFDINYHASYEIIRNEKYIDKIFQKFNFKNEDTKKKMKKVQEFLNQYIDDKYNS